MFGTFRLLDNDYVVQYELLLRKEQFNSMKKKAKYLVISCTLFMLICLSIILFVTNKHSIETPINMVIQGVNDCDKSKIVSAYHDYCRQYMEYQYREEKLQEYHNKLISDFGSNAEIAYKIVKKTKMSNDDVDKYQTIALVDYSQYDYLANGNVLSFETIYEVNCVMNIKGKSEEEGNITFFIVKIKGEYYLLDLQYNFLNQFYAE